MVLELFITIAVAAFACAGFYIAYLAGTDDMGLPTIGNFLVVAVAGGVSLWNGYVTVNRVFRHYEQFSSQIASTSIALSTNPIKDPLTLSMVYVALADARVLPEELDQICSVYHQVTGNKLKPKAVRKLAQRVHERVHERGESIERVFRGVGANFDPALKKMMLQAAFLVAIADEYIDPTEKLAVKQLAECLMVSSTELQSYIDELKR